MTSLRVVYEVEVFQKPGYVESTKEAIERALVDLPEWVDDFGVDVAEEQELV